jgi:hypothetical protein
MGVAVHTEPGAAKPVLWESRLSLSELDERLENAMRRVSAGIGADISFDRGRMRAMQDAAARALEAGMDSAGPWFMRLGRGAFEAGAFTLGNSVDLKAMAGEIMAEFHTEGTAAFQSARAALYTGAMSHLRGQGFAEDHCKTVLAAAEATFAAPDADAFTREALPLVSGFATPAVQAAVAGLGGLVCCVLLTRALPLGVIGGLALGGAAYYLARGRLRGRAELLLQQLPRKLYHLLAAGLKANISRYEETVNAALKALQSGSS